MQYSTAAEHMEVQAKLPVRDIPQGTHTREIEIVDPKDPYRKVATVMVSLLPAQEGVLEPQDSRVVQKAHLEASLRWSSGPMLHDS